MHFTWVTAQSQLTLPKQPFGWLKNRLNGMRELCCLALFQTHVHAPTWGGNKSQYLSFNIMSRLRMFCQVISSTARRVTTIGCTKLYYLLFLTSSGFNLYKAHANELLHSASQEVGQERTAGCPPARWAGLFRAGHRHRLPWPCWRPSASPRLRRLWDHRLCRHGVGTDPVHQACPPSCGMLHRSSTVLPKFCTGRAKVTSVLHLPRPTQLSCSTKKGGAVGP